MGIELMDVSLILSMFLLGVSVGNFLAQWRVGKVFKPIIDKYVREKADMWRVIKGRLLT